MKKLIFSILISLLFASLTVAAFAQATPNPRTYTGLIVDARELNIEPGIAPKIYDEYNREIYGTVNIDPDFAIKKGIVQYHDTIGEAIRKETVGDNPIVVRALSKGPHPYKADVMISIEDAEWILKANRRDHFLQDLIVVFII